MRSRVYFGRHVSSDGICMRVCTLFQTLNFIKSPHWAHGYPPSRFALLVPLDSWVVYLLTMRRRIFFFFLLCEGVPSLLISPSRFLKDCANASAALDAVGPALQGQATETAAVQDRVQQHRVTERHAAGLADRARGEAASHFEESTRAPGSEEGRGRRC